MHLREFLDKKTNVSKANISRNCALGIDESGSWAPRIAFFMLARFAGTTCDYRRSWNTRLSLIAAGKPWRSRPMRRERGPSRSHSRFQRVILSASNGPIWERVEARRPIKLLNQRMDKMITLFTDSYVAR